MSLIEIRKRSLVVETVFHEGGPPPAVPLKLAAACAVVKNPYAGRYEEMRTALCGKEDGHATERVIDVIFGAFSEAAPERAQGGPFATINALSLAGWREHRRRWIMSCDGWLRSSRGCRKSAA